MRVLGGRPWSLVLACGGTRQPGTVIAVSSLASAAHRLLLLLMGTART